MMDIQRVYGSNFCQYAKFDYKLGPGLIVLIAPNGGGKSNFVRSIYLNMKGEVYGPGNLVRDGRQTGFVAMDAVTDRGSLTVQRELKHNDKTGGTSIKHYLECSWLDDPLNKKAEVTDFLDPLIGATGASLEYITFALQGRFDELMRIEHTPRAKLLNSMMGLDRAETLRVVLKDASDLIADMPDRTLDLEQLDKDIEVKEAELVQSEQSLAELQAKLTPGVEAGYKSALVVLQLPASDYRDRDLAAKKSALELERTKLKDAQERLAALPTTVDAEPPDHNSYQNHLHYEKARKDLNAYQDQLAELTPPVKPDDEVYAICSQDEAKRLQGLRDAVGQLEAKIRGFGTGVCPTCNQTLKVDFDIEEVKKELAKQREEHDKVHAAQGEAIQKISIYTQAQAGYDAKVESAKRAVEQCEAGLDTLKAFAEFDVEAYTQAKETYEAAYAASGDRIRIEREVGMIERQVDALTASIEKLEEQQVSTPEQRTSAQKMVTAYEDTRAGIAGLNNKVIMLGADIGAKKNRRSQLHNDMDKAKINKEAKDLLQFSRDRLHVECMPRLAAQGSIGAVNRVMDKYLKMFAFPYPFRLNESLDFVVDLDHSKDVPAAVLSGGEAVRAALAMRFALMDVFSSGCGLLVIDEPTTALDKDARIALIEVLGQAAAHFRTKNTKIICPTHEEQLVAVADQVITIGE